MRKVVTVDREGGASTSKIEASISAIADVTIDASDSMPATTLTLFADVYRLEDSEQELFEHTLPGKFGTLLLRAPVHFGWDHAATMEPADLDRLLLQYAQNRRNKMRRDVIVGTQGAFKSVAKEALSEDEEEEELDEEEENMDELSADEEEEVDENFGSDEDEGEEEDDEAFCAE